MRPRNAVLRSLALLALLLLGPYGCATSEAEFWYNRGVRAHHGFDNKISHFSKAIELKPDHVDAYFNRGVAYAKIGLLDQAIVDFSKAIELKPDYPDGYRNRGLAYKLKGQYDRAMVDYGKAIELKPDYVDAYFNRGVAYAKTGLLDQAIVDFDKAIELKPDYPDVYRNRGLAYKLKGQYDRAIREYTEAIRLNSDYVTAYTNRSNAYSYKGLFDKAIEDKTTAITLIEAKGDKHKLSVAYSDRGYLYQEKGSYERAVSDLNRAIELNPNYAHSYSHLAWLRAASPDAVFRNGKRAVELAERAVWLVRDAHSLDALSAAYAEVSRFEEAISTQSEAIDLLKKENDESAAANFERHLERYRTRKPWRMNEHEDGPDDPTSDTKLNSLAELYRAQGKYAAAEPLYKQALAIREKARQREEARKREKQQRLEALSGRYVTAGGRSQWDIRFQGNRFEARYLRNGRRTLLYDGNVTGTRISGRKHNYSTSMCRHSSTTPLYGNVDLRRKSIEISYGDYNLVEMIKHKKCVTITTQRKWTQEDRQ